MQEKVSGIVNEHYLHLNGKLHLHKGEDSGSHKMFKRATYNDLAKERKINKYIFLGNWWTT